MTPDRHHVRVENADYFLIVLDHGTVYVAVYTDIARFWDITVANTKTPVPSDHPVGEEVRAEAYGYAILHPGEVVPSLMAEAEEWRTMITTAPGER